MGIKESQSKKEHYIKMDYSTVKEAYEKNYNECNDYQGFYAFESPFFDDAVTHPMKHAFEFFKSGSEKEDLLIQYGGANNLALILPAIGHFKEIIVIEPLEGRLQAFKNWMNKEPEAHDYSEAEKMIGTLEGDSGNVTGKAETARKSVTKLIKSDLMDTYPMAPKIADQADCLITSYSTEVLSSDLNAYRAAVRSMSPLIKMGGSLIMNVILGCNFVVIGEHKLPILSLEEEFVKEVVTEEGFVISNLYVTPRSNNTFYDKINFRNVMFVTARKVNNVE